MPKGDKLTGKQYLFVEVYLKTFNATEAARQAGYKGNDSTLAVVGSENLTKPLIRQAVEARLAELGITDPAQVATFKRTRKASRPSVVYLIRAANGLVKIGKTFNVVKRFNTLNIGSPLDLEVVGVIHSENANEIERDLHARFADRRVKGEWFNLSSDDLAQVNQFYIVTPVGG